MSLEQKLAKKLERGYAQRLTLQQLLNVLRNVPQAQSDRVVQALAASDTRLAVRLLSTILQREVARRAEARAAEIIAAGQATLAELDELID